MQSNLKGREVDVDGRLCNRSQSRIHLIFAWRINSRFSLFQNLGFDYIWNCCLGRSSYYRFHICIKFEHTFKVTVGAWVSSISTLPIPTLSISMVKEKSEGSKGLRISKSFPRTWLTVPSLPPMAALKFCILVCFYVFLKTTIGQEEMDAPREDGLLKSLNTGTTKALLTCFHVANPSDQSPGRSRPCFQYFSQAMPLSSVLLKCVLRKPGAPLVLAIANPGNRDFEPVDSH